MKEDFDFLISRFVKSNSSFPIVSTKVTFIVCTSVQPSTITSVQSCTVVHIIRPFIVQSSIIFDK